MPNAYSITTITVFFFFFFFCFSLPSANVKNRCLPQP